jgi:hypothetical protein
VQPAPASPLVTRHAIVFWAVVGEKFTLARSSWAIFKSRKLVLGNQCL